VTDKKQPRKPGTEGHLRCQIGCNADGTPAFCAELGKMEVDGLLLCEGHALEAKLEGQIFCWDGMLFYMDLWSREASRRNREDVVRLLEVHRAEVKSAMARARSDLDRARGASSWGSPENGRSPPLTRGSPLASPRGVLRHFRGFLRR
jgi:hypothetical protein